MISQKVFKGLLKRDLSCVHCGAEDTLIVHHRINRQMGGAKGKNNPRGMAANLLILCSAFNVLIEANADAAALARKHGIKLNTWQNPETTPVWYASESAWYLLDNLGNRIHWLSEN